MVPSLPDRGDAAKFAAMPRRLWNGDPITHYDGDQYFFDEEDLLNWIVKHEIDLTDLKLIFCTPNYPSEKDNLSEIRQLRNYFEKAPIDGITPAHVAKYRDARTAPVRANREIATLSHVFKIAREWGLTTKENPCQGVRKNKEVPRDF